MALTIKVPIKPMTDTTVSIKLHDLMVSLIDRLKYSLKSQNPESFTCENNKLPEPTARTIKLGSTPKTGIMGAIIPAVVSPATVAEPIAMRMTPATNQPKIKGGRFIG